MDYKAILGTIPTMQSLALASSAYSGSFKLKKRKNGVKKIISSGVKVMIGAPMIQSTAQIIGGM